MNKSIDKQAHEIMGLCWHEWDLKGICADYQTGMWKCVECGEDVGPRIGTPPNPSYSTSWADAGKLVEWVERQYRYFSLRRFENGEWCAEFATRSPGYADIFKVTAPTAPEAITRAFIAANGG